MKESLKFQDLEECRNGLLTCYGQKFDKRYFQRRCMKIFWKLDKSCFIETKKDHLETILSEYLFYISLLEILVVNSIFLLLYWKNCIHVMPCFQSSKIFQKSKNRSLSKVQVRRMKTCQQKRIEVNKIYSRHINWDSEVILGRILDDTI